MKIAEYRKKKQISQAQLAEQISQYTQGKPLVQQSNIASWERGSVPSKRFRDAIEAFTRGWVKPKDFL